jgi:hypothetical protein
LRSNFQYYWGSTVTPRGYTHKGDTPAACRGAVEWAAIINMGAALGLYSHSCLFMYPTGRRRSWQGWPLPDEGFRSRVRGGDVWGKTEQKSDYPRRSSHLVALPSTAVKRDGNHSTRTCSTIVTRHLRRGVEAAQLSSLTQTRPVTHTHWWRCEGR